MISLAIVLLVRQIYLLNDEDTNIISANTNEEKTYNYSIETEEFGTIYIHGSVPKRKNKIGEEDAVKIANQKFLDEGYLDNIDGCSHTLIYHLNYINIISSEYSMWAVFAEIDGEYQYECMVSVKTGEINACFPTKEEED